VEDNGKEGNTLSPCLDGLRREIDSHKYETLAMFILWIVGSSTRSRVSKKGVYDATRGFVVRLALVAQRKESLDRVYGNLANSSFSKYIEDRNKGSCS
jgi:hypothetical protein